MCVDDKRCGCPLGQASQLEERAPDREAPATLSAIAKA